MEIWPWLIFALVLVLIELFTGTAYFLWLSFSALAMALIVWLFPTLSSGMQAIFFAGSAVTSLSLLWFIRDKHKRNKREEITLNEKARLLIGKKFVLNDSMQDYQGHLMIDGVLWRIKAEENYTIGTMVQIKNIEGNILIVRSI